MADTPPPFDPKAATPYTEDSETPPPFDPKAATAYSPTDTGPTREDEFRDAVSGLDPQTYADLKSIPVVGGAVAPVADYAARGVEQVTQLPQYLANKIDDATGMPIANTALEMLMAASGEGSMEGGITHAVKDTRVANALRTGDVDSRAIRPTPDAPVAAPEAPVDPQVISSQRTASLKQDIADGRDSGYIAQKYPGIDVNQLNAVLEARHAGRPWDVADPLAGQPNTPDAAPFSAADQNAQATQAPDVVAAADASPLAKEAAAFKPTEAPVEAPAFQGSREPTETDLWPTDESRAADTAAQTDKLQAEADAFLKGKDSASDTPPPFDAAQAEPVVPEETAPASPDERSIAVDHANEVHSSIEDMTKDWTNKPAHTIYPSTADITDPALKQAMENDPDALGVYKDGHVHIVADRLSKPEDVVPIFYHEALAHHGLASKFGDALDDKLKEWYNGNSGGFKADVDKWLERNPDAYAGQDRLARAAEEVLAERTEGGKIDLTMPEKIKQVVRQFGRKMGIVKDFTDSDIHAILSMAHAATTDGAESAAANGFKFSRAANDNNKERLRIPSTPPYGADDARWGQYHEESAAYNRSRAEYHRGNGDERRAYLHEVSAKMDDRAATKRFGITIPHRESAAYFKDMADHYRGEAKHAEVRGDLRTAQSKARDALDHDERAAHFSKEALKDPTAGNKYARRRTVDDSEEAKEKSVIIGGTNLGKMETYHDVTQVAQHLVDMQPERPPQTLAETKAMGQALNLNVNKVLNKSGRVVGGLKNIDQLPQQIAALRQIHTEFTDRAASFMDKFNKEGYNEADHANMMQKLVQTIAIDAKLRDDRAAVARALGAFRITTSSAKAVGDMLKKLQESGGGLGALADKDQFMKFMAQVNEEGRGNPDGVPDLVQKIAKPYWWQYLLTGHNASMLSGMSTQMKNFADNSGLLARDLMDTAGAMVGGNVTKTEMAGRIHALGQGLLDGAAYKHIVAGIVDAGKSKDTGAGKFDESHGQTAYVPVASHVLATLEGADHFFKNLHMGMNLRALGIRQAQSEGLSGAQALQRGEYLAKNAPPSMMEKAMLVAKRNLLQDASSAPTQWVERAKAITPGMSGARQLASFSANLIFPFVRVADRTFVRQLERSPLGFFQFANKSLKDAIESGDKHARDIAYSRAAIGTALMTYYWTQAAGGKITGMNPDAKKAAALGVDGYQPGSTNDNGQYTDATAVGTNVNPLSLSNATAVNVASIQNAYARGASMADTLKQLGEVATGIVYDNTVLKDITPVGVAAQSAEKGDPESAGSSFVAAQANSWVPNAMKQTNQTLFDKTKRDTTGDKSVGGRIAGAIKGDFSQTSEALPARYDTFGQLQDQGKSVTGLTNYNLKSTDPTIMEMARLERSTKGVLITPVTAAKWTMEGREATLTDQQRSEFQKRAGQNFKSAADNLVAQPGWRGMPAAEKKSAVKDANKDAKKAAKESMIQDGTVPVDQFVIPANPDEGKF